MNSSTSTSNESILNSISPTSKSLSSLPPGTITHMTIPSYLSTIEPSIVLPNQQVLTLSEARRVISIALTVPELLELSEHKLEIYSMDGGENDNIYHGSFEIEGQYFEIYQAKTLEEAEGDLMLQAAVHFLWESEEVATKWEEVQEILRTRSITDAVEESEAVQELEAGNKSTFTASFDDPSDLPLPSASTSASLPTPSDDDPLEDALPSSPFNFAIPTTLNELQPLLGSLLSPPLSHLLQSIFPSTTTTNANASDTNRTDRCEDRINFMQVVAGVAKAAAGLQEVLINVRREADVMREEFARADPNNFDVTDTGIQEDQKDQEDQEEKEEKEEEKKEEKVEVEEKAADGKVEQVEKEKDAVAESRVTAITHTTCEVVLPQETSIEEAELEKVVAEPEEPQVILDAQPQLAALKHESLPPTVRLSVQSLKDLALEGKRERKAARDERRKAKAIRLEARLEKKLSIREGKSVGGQSLVESVDSLAPSLVEPEAKNVNEIATLSSTITQASPKAIPQASQLAPQDSPQAAARASLESDDILLSPVINPVTSSQRAPPTRPIPPTIPKAIVSTTAAPRLPTVLHSLSMPGSYHASRYSSSVHSPRNPFLPTRTASVNPEVVTSPRAVTYHQLVEALQKLELNLGESRVQIAIMDVLKEHRHDGLDKVIDEILRKIWS